MVDGYKTYIGGYGLIFTALGMFTKMVVDNNNNFDNMGEAITIFCNGLGLIGIRHKLSKGKK